MLGSIFLYPIDSDSLRWASCWSICSSLPSSSSWLSWSHRCSSSPSNLFLTLETLRPFDFFLVVFQLLVFLFSHCIHTLFLVTLVVRSSATQNLLIKLRLFRKICFNNFLPNLFEPGLSPHTRSLQMLTKILQLPLVLQCVDKSHFPHIHLEPSLGHVLLSIQWTDQTLAYSPLP